MVLRIIDIETTGFDKSCMKDAILEVGYVNVTQNLEIVGSGAFYFYRPEFNVESPAQSIHQLERSFLEQHASMFNVNLARLYTLCYDSVFIGKNSNAFDIPFIASFINKYADGVKPLKLMGTLDLQDIYADKYRAWYKEETGTSAGRKKGKLGDYIKIAGYTEDDLKRMFSSELGIGSRGFAHSALFDAYMTYKALEYSVHEMGVKLAI